MTLPQKKSNFAAFKWAFIGAGSTILLALDGFGFWNSINPKIFSTSVATAITQNSVARKLIGRWQIQVSGQSFILIFTQEGKLFWSNTPTSLMELEYRTDVSRQPKYLDLLVGNQVIARTIFDFTADGKLRLELDNIGESRPTSFSSNAKVFRKISEQTALPANVTVVNPEEQQKRARQAKAKMYVGFMNQAQRAVYAETNSFTFSIERLQIGMKSEMENYLYSIVLSNNKRWVQAIALPKIDGLKNYTGIVYLVTSAGGEQTTSSILCESNQPSKKLPGSPVVNNSTSNLQCPVGYSQIN